MGDGAFWSMIGSAAPAAIASKWRMCASMSRPSRAGAMTIAASAPASAPVRMWATVSSAVLGRRAHHEGHPPPSLRPSRRTIRSRSSGVSVSTSDATPG
jgi:hypothetical protein